MAVTAYNLYLVTHFVCCMYWLYVSSHYAEIAYFRTVKVIMLINFFILSLVKSEFLHCSLMCAWIHCSQLVKGVPLAGLLPVLFVAFITCRNTSNNLNLLDISNFHGQFEV
ncbi:hypothetical protein DAPPUDRAFT_324154 [Daphnia pulex]|uniref:Uncharacterized protein n=1 Tax=Daphnia pulex TaxID=6669 RepID=E9H0V5_DAPPU|nr:hypothetical protein DAPPUDRAFT_324154 [Daphnia pulex]|eukprot:EFX74635.1 hypothetical protein DAPPUDRAFT_324154 [Daphnia pulex]